MAAIGAIILVQAHHALKFSVIKIVNCTTKRIATVVIN